MLLILLAINGYWIEYVPEYQYDLDFPGVDITQTGSGIFNASKRYENQDRFIIPISFLSNAQQKSMVEMLTVIGGVELPFYMKIIPLDPTDPTIIYRLRLASNKSPFAFVFGNDVPWRIGPTGKHHWTGGT